MRFDRYKSSIYLEPLSSLKGDSEAVFCVGKKVMNVEYTDKRVIVQYYDLLDSSLYSLEADLVIVADSSSSQIRPRLLL